jgi:CBS domain-containing protein
VDRLSIEPLIARADDDLLDVVRRVAAQPQTRLVGVVDEAGRLIGVTPILRLAESVVARVAPEILLSDITDLDEVARFGDEIEARTVGDVMLPPASIPASATLDEAFRLMHKRRLSGLYVVDAAGRPTGYLDLLELAILYADALDQGDSA